MGESVADRDWAVVLLRTLLRREAEQLMGPTSQSKPDDAEPLDKTIEAPNERPNEEGTETQDQEPKEALREGPDTDP